MNLSEALMAGGIKELSSSEKYGAINELIELADQKGLLNDKAKFKEAVVNRERQQSTGLENGVAVPHALSEGVREVFACLGISKDGVEFQTLDGKPAKLIFLIGAPPAMNTDYLSVLSKVARMFIRPEMRRKVLEAPSPEDVMRIIKEEELRMSGGAGLFR